MLLVGCYFLKINISSKILLKKTIKLGLAVSLIRMLPISFGIHTLIGMGLILLELINLSKDSFINCIIALCKIFLCLGMSEIIYIKILTEIFKIPEHVFVYNYTLYGAIYTLPSLLIFLILAVMIEYVLQKLKNKGIVNNNE